MEIYLVGGAVRDALLGLPVRERDWVVVGSTSEEMLRLGYLPLIRAIPLSGTAHACGTLVTGNDPNDSVVDAEGRVHGLDNVYVVDGSVLPRSSRVNPALTIYAWGLRVASRIESRAPARAVFAVEI